MCIRDRVNVAVLQHLAVDNTAAQNFDPAGVLAQRAALAAALKAADIDLDVYKRQVYRSPFIGSQCPA